MELMEILLLVAGVAVFVISFLVQDNGPDVDAGSITEEEIRHLVKEEYKRSRGKLDDLTDETVNYTMEKAERQLERLTSEKMLAMGEYSDTILSEINKNHQEAVFLNDMLNQNKRDLSVLLSQAIRDAKESSELSQKSVAEAQKALDMASAAVEKSSKAVDKSVVAEENMITARKLVQPAQSDVEVKPKLSKSRKKAVKSDENEEYQIEGQIELPLDDQEFLLKSLVDESEGVKLAAKDSQSAEKKKQSIKSGSTAQAVKKTTRKTAKTEANNNNNNNKVSVQFVAENASSDNNNEKILRLYRQGKSNVAIAKELGLGVGEVKLVIDLFK